MTLNDKCCNIRSAMLRHQGKCVDECKTHLCFEFISHAILSILYPYSCKTQNICYELGFVEFLMESQQ